MFTYEAQANLMEHSVEILLADNITDDPPTTQELEQALYATLVRECVQKLYEIIAGKGD